MKTLRPSTTVEDRSRSAPSDSQDARAARGSLRLSITCDGFTLVELLVVIGIIAILAGLLFPVLSKTKAKGRQVQCLNNLRQFGLAWTMHAHDNDGTVARNLCYDSPENWVRGYLGLWHPDNRDNTNTAYLRSSLLAPYLNHSVEVWHCPADKNTVTKPPTYYYNKPSQKLPLARSISMNSWLNTAITTDEAKGYPDYYKNIRKISDMVDPNPSKTFVILDERAESIGDGWFGVTMAARGRLAEFWSLPASYHNGACNFSFADGHVETHKWRDPRTNPRMRSEVYLYDLKSRNNPDVEWLQDHATGLK